MSIELELYKKSLCLSVYNIEIQKKSEKQKQRYINTNKIHKYKN